MLDKVATERVLSHVPGKPVKQKAALLDYLPDVVNIPVKAASFNGENSDPGVIRVVTEINARRVLAVLCDSATLQHVRLAMMSTVADTTQRKRPGHAERVSATTGCKGVWKQEDRLQVRYVDNEGRKKKSQSQVHGCK